MKNPVNASGAAVLQKLDEQLNKYRFMDANLQQKKKRSLPVASLSVVLVPIAEYVNVYVKRLL